MAQLVVGLLLLVCWCLLCCGAYELVTTLMQLASQVHRQQEEIAELLSRIEKLERAA